MTKFEAIIAMDKGHKVRHRFFAPGEFIRIGVNNNNAPALMDENQGELNWEEFWGYRTSSNFDNDWEIHKG